MVDFFWITASCYFPEYKSFVPSGISSITSLKCWDTDFTVRVFSSVRSKTIVAADSSRTVTVTVLPFSTNRVSNGTRQQIVAYGTIYRNIIKNQRSTKANLVSLLNLITVDVIIIKIRFGR